MPVFQYVYIKNTLFDFQNSSQRRPLFCCIFTGTSTQQKPPAVDLKSFPYVVTPGESPSPSNYSLSYFVPRGMIRTTPVHLLLLHTPHCPRLPCHLSLTTQHSTLRRNDLPHNTPESSSRVHRVFCGAALAQGVAWVGSRLLSGSPFHLQISVFFFNFPAVELVFYDYF